MSLTIQDAERLRQCLAEGGVAIVPTDTVYGIVWNPDDDTAGRRVFELKRRPPAKPAAVMFFDPDAALGLLMELGPRTRAALAALLPGPVTVLLANPEYRFPLVCDPPAAGAGLIGLRVPRLPPSLVALSKVGVPIAQSSANLSGGTDPRSLQDVPAELRAGVDLTLDGGELPGMASTVLDLSEYEHRGDWRIVREGPLTHAAITSALARLLAS